MEKERLETAPDRGGSLPSVLTKRELARVILYGSQEEVKLELVTMILEHIEKYDLVGTKRHRRLLEIMLQLREGDLNFITYQQAQDLREVEVNSLIHTLGVEVASDIDVGSIGVEGESFARAAKVYDLKTGN